MQLCRVPNARQRKAHGKINVCRVPNARQIFFPNNGGDLLSNFAERLQQNTRKNIFYLIFAERQHQNTRHNIFLKFPEANFAVCLLQNTRQFFPKKAAATICLVPGRQALGKVYFAECLGLALGKVFF